MKNNMKKTKLLALTMGACAAAVLFPVQTVSAQAFTPEQKAELEELVKQYIVGNPESILESVDRYRTEQEQKTQQSAQDSLSEYQEYFKTATLPMAGNPEGDVTVVEFFDYNCGYCRKAYEDIMGLLKDDTNVRVVFQEMPILSPSSQLMSTIALAAKMQGKYFEMHQGLMDYKGTQTEEAYFKIAEKIGLDLEKLKTDMASDAVKGEVEKSMEVARALGIRGTPGFVIGDTIFPGYVGLDALKKGVSDARAAKAQ